MKLTGTFVFSYSIFKVRLKNFPPEYDFPFQTVTSMLPPPKFSVKRFFNLDYWHFPRFYSLRGYASSQVFEAQSENRQPQLFNTIPKIFFLLCEKNKKISNMFFLQAIQLYSTFIKVNIQSMWYFSYS